MVKSKGDKQKYEVEVKGAVQRFFFFAFFVFFWAPRLFWVCHEGFFEAF